MSYPRKEKGCKINKQERASGYWRIQRLKINIQKKRKKVVDENFRKWYKMIYGNYER